MKKQYKLALLVCTALLLGAWEVRPNFNKPRSINITPNASSIIPVVPKPRDGIHHSLVMSDLDGKGYSHIGAISSLQGAFSILTSENAGAPSASSTEKLYVASGGTATFDDVSVFKYLFILSEETSSLTSGNLKLMVW